MSNLPATRTTGEISTIVVSREHKDLVKATIFPDATDAELDLFIFQCQRKGVHPLDKMIHPIKMGGKLTMQSGIDFMRSEAEATKEYDGQDEPEFEWENDKEAYPSLARVKVYRKGFSRPFVGVARWDEFYPGEAKGHMYRKMPCNQLAKCAEAQALRKAFPKILGDLYCPEEMEQAKGAHGTDSKTRTASVKGTGKTSQAPGVVEAELVEENPLDAEIYSILKEIIPGGDFAMLDAAVKEASHYKDASKKVFEFGFERIPTASAAWKTKTVLPRLRKKLEEFREAAAEGRGEPINGEEPAPD